MDHHLDQFPCPVVLTDRLGDIIAVNTELLTLVGGTADRWVHRAMDDLLPPDSRIFLQTHVWPILLSEGTVREFYLHLRPPGGKATPVMVNGQIGQFKGQPCYYWVMFPAVERSKFEQDLLAARHRAEAVAHELAARERFVNTITDAMPGLVAYWSKDLICRFANKSYMAWFGLTQDQAVGMSMPDLLGEQLYKINEHHVQEVLQGRRQQFERTLTKLDGSTGYTLAAYIPDVDECGAIIGFFAVVNDVTPIKLAQADLRLAASVFSNTIEGIMVTDAQGVILSVNPSFTEITGYTTDEAIGQTPRLLRSERNDAPFFATMWAAIAAHGRWEGETWNRRKSGDAFLMWQSITTIRDTADGPVRYLSVFSDITERKRNDERIRHLAFHDPLTNLPNRPLLMERLGQLLAMTEREQRNVVVMFLDLDRFKVVNDSQGHEMGDLVLIEVARRLVEQVRHTDTVARLGGDEFVVLLDNPANQLEVARIAARIVASINEPIVFPTGTAHVGTSIGLAIHPTDGATPAALLKSADFAMYAAKDAGKNTYRFFKPEMLGALSDASSP
jgi:diguanylate cyclase (GGDEF)-like protein/PAS domain S-box-containing protein